jgi:hypothetical protein
LLFSHIPIPSDHVFAMSAFVDKLLLPRYTSACHHLISAAKLRSSSSPLFLVLIVLRPSHVSQVHSTPPPHSLASNLPFVKFLHLRISVINY